MAKKHARRRSSPRGHQAGASAPAANLGAFDAAYQAGDHPQALTLAEALVRSYPSSAKAYERYVNILGTLKRFREAGEAMAKVIKLSAAPNAAQRLKLAQYQVMAGLAKASVPNLEAVLNEQPDHFIALVWISRAYHQLGNNEKAIEASNSAYALDPQHGEMLQWRAVILDRLLRHDDALETLQRLLSVDPQRRGANNQIAGLYVKEGDYQKAEAHYAKEMELGEDATNGPAYSNLLIAAHYNPGYSAEDITSKVLEWDPRFASRSPLGRATTSKEPTKRLRIGLLSGGFRLHPVGQMILPALRHLSIEQVELVAYSTSQSIDSLTEQVRQFVQHWEVVDGLDDSQLEQKIRNDGIDILIDMNGGGEGSRYTVLTREPAPLIVKWVGGLINTTGLGCFDYLLSDSIETPEGLDDFYTEKLIRLPDDYICYHLPDYAPSAGVLPALRNGYITFGCLNTPAKLSPPLLGEWSILLKEVPDSRLLLRGMQFESARYRDKVAGIFAEHGIEADRLIMEKGAPHQEFLATYQRIDIALDTWPYSGGLTTCEALMMGVPVVTRVGPTFAGRHSATHLVNAGLSELVTDSWEEFRQGAKELANDLPNLAVIRAALRTILVDSPICNGPRFANHLTTALRAIWQRHCEGKAPEALTFNKSGAAQFADEDSPVKLALALPSEGFDWQLESPVLAVDNGAVLASRPDARELLGSGRVVMLSFDPGGKLETVDHLAQYGEIQHFPYTSLGDGQPVTLYVGRDVKPATLPSLDEELAVEEHSIPSVSLDSIEGLPSIDLLALDASHDSLTILENGTQALQEALLIQASFSFQPTLQNQPDFAKLKALMARHEFRFYCFKDMAYQSHLPESVPPENFQATELASADALFIPSVVRMTKLSDAQRIKLAFLLHTIFGIKDMAYEVLAAVDEKQAEAYWEVEILASASRDSARDTEITPRSEHAEAVAPYHSCTNNVSDYIDELLGSRAPSESAASSADEQSISKDADHISTTPKASKNLWELEDFIHVVDVGANPIDGTPPYSSLLKKGVVKLVGFEPQKDALQKLQAMKGPNETYLPHAVGTGEKTKLYLCQASGMTSTLKPNNLVLDHFQGYPIWGKVKSVEEIDTVRLDDLDKIEKIDWLKIDIQGGELNVFQNAEEKLKDALVIQTEVNFIQLYENQPLFAEIDQWMRSHGFMLHTLLEQRKRLYAPMKINGGIHQGINQLTTADAVYVLDFKRLNKLSTESFKKLLHIMHEAYQSYDYALKIITLFGSKKEVIKYSKDSDVLISRRAEKKEPKNSIGNLLISHSESYLRKMGWPNSIINKESTVHNKPAPWVTYPFLHFFEKRVKISFKVFEYGSGNSTLWLSQRVKEMVSVEHDEHWYKKMYDRMPSNVNYIFHPLVYGGEYSKEILGEKYNDKFDVVFVDGRDRTLCLKNCLSALNGAGVVVLDNAERQRYNPGSDYLIENGFKRVDFIGMGPVNIMAWSTAVFYRANNCLDL